LNALALEQIFKTVKKSAINAINVRTIPDWEKAMLPIQLHDVQDKLLEIIWPKFDIFFGKSHIWLL
jgi:hypothetical protein